MGIYNFTKKAAEQDASANPSSNPFGAPRAQEGGSWAKGETTASFLERQAFEAEEKSKTKKGSRHV